MNITGFIKQDNLIKLSRSELMEIWGFMISDMNRIDLIDKIKLIIDSRDNKEVPNGPI